MKILRKLTCIVFLMSLISLPIISFADQKDNVVSDDDIKYVVMEFIEGPFSVDKPISEFSMIDSREEDFIYYINKRVDIINKRISAFGNEADNIKLEFKDWNIERLIDNIVVVNVYVSSEFNYIDSSIQSSSGVNYTVYISILDNNILVKDALSDDPWSQFFERDFKNLKSKVKPMSDFNSIKSNLEVDRSKIDELINNEKENIALELKAESFSNLDKEESIAEDHEVMPRATLRSLDRNNMRTYIRNWANGRNPSYVDLTGSGGDCANFASQVLVAGGTPEDRVGDYHWYYNGWNSERSWVYADYLQRYTYGNTGYGISSNQKYWLDLYPAQESNLQVGDLIFLYRYTSGGNESAAYHTLIVSQRKTGSNKTCLVSAHTSNAFDKPITSYPNRKLLRPMKGYYK